MADATGIEVLKSQEGPSGPYLHMTDEEVLAAVDLGQEGLEGVGAAVARADYDAAWEQWGQYWASRGGPTYYVNPGTYGRELNEKLPELARVVVARADEFWDPDFHHATYTPKREGRAFQWVDQVADSAYCGLHYLWFIKELGRAYLLTGDAKYPAMFREIVCSWFDALPELVTNASYQGTEANRDTGLALLWNGGLGSSVRCVAMLDCYFLMRDSSEFTTELHRKILRIFLGHARYMFDGRMKEYTPSNFQATMTCWLISAGIMLPELREAEGWLKLGIERLQERIDQNFEDDGAQVEQCPQYHLAGMRDMTRPLLLLHLNGHDEALGPDLTEKLETIYDYPIRIAHPTGHLGLFNSGVYCTEWQPFLALGWRLFRSPLQGWASARFIRDGFIPLAKNVSEYVTFMDGDWLEAVREAREQELEPPPFTDDLLADSGTAVIRTGWDPNAHSLIFDYNRQPWGGHAYPGRLSFDLFANGVPLVTNPGSTASYAMPEYRGWCHRTISHNTVLVNERCQGKPHVAELDAWYSSERIAFVSASTPTYEESDGVVHQRCILAVKGEYYFILDWLRGGADGTPLAWLLHSPQDLAPRPDGTVASSPGKPGLIVVPDSLTSSHSELQMDTGYGAVPVDYYPGYQPLDAWRDDIPYLRLNSQIDGGVGGQTYGVVIAPFACELPDVSVTTVGSESGDLLREYRVRIRLGESADSLLFTASDGKTVCRIERTNAIGRVLWSVSTS